MGRLSERLAEFPRVGLDTSIFIYHFEAHPLYAPLSAELLSLVESGQHEGLTSTITLMEIIVRPLKLQQAAVARRYEALLVNFPNLTIIDLDRDVIRQAARLRAELQIRPADALQAAAALTREGKAFVTNDRRLSLLQPYLEIIYLDSFLERG